MVEGKTARSGIVPQPRWALCVSHNIFMEDVVPSRMPEALLSPNEIESLRCVASGLGERISPVRRNMLVDMGLVRMDSSGVLALTEAGASRLDQEASGLKR